MNIQTESWATNQTASNWNYFYFQYTTDTYRLTSTTQKDTDSDPRTTITVETDETGYTDASLIWTVTKQKNESAIFQNVDYETYTALQDGHVGSTEEGLQDGNRYTAVLDNSNSVENRNDDGYYYGSDAPVRYSTSDTSAVKSTEEVGTGRLRYELSEATSYTPICETYKDGTSTNLTNYFSEVSYKRPKSKTAYITDTLWSFEGLEDTITRRLVPEILTFSTFIFGRLRFWSRYGTTPIPSSTVTFEPTNPIRQYKIDMSVATVEPQETLFVMTENSVLKTLIGQNQNWAAYTEGEYSFTKEKSEDFTKFLEVQKYYTFEETSRGATNVYKLYFGQTYTFYTWENQPRETSGYTYTFFGFGEESESETTVTYWTVEDFTKTEVAEETYTQKNTSKTTTSWNYLPVDTTSTFRVINTGTTEQVIPSYETFDNGFQTITTQVGYISLEAETTFLDWSVITFETKVSHITERIHPIFQMGYAFTETKEDYGPALYSQNQLLFEDPTTTRAVSNSGSITVISSIYYNEAYFTQSICDAAIKVYTPQHGSGFYAFGNDKNITTNELYAGIRATHEVGSLANFDSVDSSVWMSLARAEVGLGGGFIVMTDSCYLPEPNTSMTLSWSTIENGPASSLGSTLVAKLSSKYDGEIMIAEDIYKLELVAPCKSSTAHIAGDIEAVSAATFLAETVELEEGNIKGYPYVLSAYIVARNDKLTDRERTVVYDRGLYTVKKSKGGFENGQETITVEEDYSSTFIIENNEEWFIIKENLVFLSTYAGGNELLTESRADDFILKYYNNEEQPDFTFDDFDDDAD